MKVVIGTYDGGLMGWESNFDADPTGHTLQLTYAFGAHDGSVRALALHDTAGGSGSTLVSGGIDETIRVFNLRRHKEVGSLLEHKAAVTALDFFRGSHLLSGDQSGSVCVWRTSDWLCLDHMRGHKGSVNSISIHPTGRLALSVAGDRTLIMWDLTKGKAAFSTRLPGPAQRVAWACGGAYFLVVFDASMAIHDGTTGALIRRCGDSESAESLGTGISGVSKICDVTVVAAPAAPAASGSVSSSKGASAKAGKAAAKGGAGAASSSAAAEPETGSGAGSSSSTSSSAGASTALVVCGHEGGDVAVWEIPSGRLIRRFATGHARRVRAVAYCDGVTPAEVAAAAARASASGGASASASAADATALSDDLNPLSRLAAASKLQTVLPVGCGPLLATSDSEGTVKLWRAAEALSPAPAPAASSSSSSSSSSSAASSAATGALAPVATLTAAAGSRITCLTASRRAAVVGGAGGDADADADADGDNADVGIGSGSAAALAASAGAKGKAKALHGGAGTGTGSSSGSGGKRKHPDAPRTGAGTGSGTHSGKHAAHGDRSGDAAAAAKRPRSAHAADAGAGAGGKPAVKVSFASKKARDAAAPAPAAGAVDAAAGAGAGGKASTKGKGEPKRAVRFSA